jgi:hypothetical protein
MCRHLVRGRRPTKAQNGPQGRGLSRGGISSALSEQSQAGEAPAKERLRGTSWPVGPCGLLKAARLGILRNDACLWDGERFVIPNAGNKRLVVGVIAGWQWLVQPGWIQFDPGAGGSNNQTDRHRLLGRAASC